METVDDRGWKGVLKRIDYERAFGSNARPDFFLPIGRNMPDWILARGVDAERIFPFAYFLDPRSDGPRSRRPGPFRFGFVGRFEQRKRLDLLICSLAILARREFEIVVIGAGPLENSLRKLAGARLNASKVHWLGQIERSRALTEIGGLDCLVLPSDHDGWGAVVSEALIAGVPAVCSDACGSAIAVEHSDVGGVFPRGDVVALAGMLGKMIDSGPVGLDQRERIVQWARCLTSEVGARYLESISRCFYDARPRPDPPWQPGREQSQTVRS
jgi:glycosyltransferase involved in cell wall biosynthesis